MKGDILLSDVPRLVRELRAFIGPVRLRETERRLGDIDCAGNPFRSLLAREKQPLLSALHELDSVTMHGGRPLKKRHFSKSIFGLAYLAMLCARIKATLPKALAEHHAAKLADMHGKRLSVLTEWETADFYLAKGFKIAWTDLGTSGPEFVATKEDLSAEFECKRYSRAGMEKLQDREAANIAQMVLVEMRRSERFGQATLTIPHDPVPPIEPFLPQIQRLIGDSKVDQDIPELGHFSFREDNRPKSLDEVTQLLQDAPHDCRKYVVGHKGRVRLLLLKGPRLTATQFMAHIESELLAAASKQLSGVNPGFLVVEIEDLDVEIYGDKIVFDQIATRVFDQNAHAGGIVWRTSHVFEFDGNGFTSRIDGLAMRNANCAFVDAKSIPLVL